MTKVTTEQHRILEAHALRIKIEKLSQWMQLYRDDKLQIESTRHVIAVMALLHQSQSEQNSLLIKIQNVKS